MLSPAGLKLKQLASSDAFNCALVLSVVLAVYHTAFGHGFIQDDFVFIYFARGFDLYSAFVTQFFSVFFYRPVTLGFLYYFCYSLFHLDPVGYHVVTFTLFILTAFFVYVIGKELAGRRDLALIAAVFYVTRGALFTEMYWIGCGFSETGTVLFILMAVYAYMAYMKKRNHLRYFLCFTLFLISLASKELGIVVPVLLLLIEARREGFGEDLKGVFLRLLPFGAVTLVYLSRLLIVTPMISTGPYTMSFTIATVAANLAFYLRNSFNSRYELVLLAPLLAVAFLGAKDRKPVLVYSAWFLAGLLPVIFMGQHASPHYLSLPLVGFSWLLAAGVKNCYDRIGAYKGALAIALIAALLITAYVSVSAQERLSGVVLQEKRSDNALQALGEASPSYPDGSLIYIMGADKDIYSALGFGKAVNLYYGDNVSTYFENREAAPAGDFSAVYYFSYGDEGVRFMKSERPSSNVKAVER